MRRRQQDLKCLICGAKIVHSHMGIDSCRACAIFYKRSLKVEDDLKCSSGLNSCFSEGKTIGCRKCRFNRFHKIFSNASADEQQNEDNDPESSIYETVEESEPPFIDHESFFVSEPSCSDTPLLDRMKQAYRHSSRKLGKFKSLYINLVIELESNTLCLIRKAGEMGPLHHRKMHDFLKGNTMTLRPSQYSLMVPYSHIFFSGVMDFARYAFADIRKLSPEERHSLVESNFQLIQSLDGSYRGHHLFPTEDTVMATYSTFVNDETLDKFFEDCPSDVNKVEAVEQFSANMKRTIKTTKSEFGRVKPSVDEFIALFGLALWNDRASSLSSQLADLVKKNRREIMHDLHKMYTRKGIKSYATRLGELFCLLVTEERVLDLTNEHIQMYRTMHLFNEAYD